MDRGRAQALSPSVSMVMMKAGIDRARGVVLAGDGRWKEGSGEFHAAGRQRTAKALSQRFERVRPMAIKDGPRRGNWRLQPGAPQHLNGKRLRPTEADGHVRR